MKKAIIFYIVYFLADTGSIYSDYTLLEEFNKIKMLTNNPDQSLKQLGPLVTLGNSSLDDAKIIFLPEIHDNEKSLLTQLLLLSFEKKRYGSLYVLDESLAALKKSPWELFSQKTMEILAARISRENREIYEPKMFEKKLENISMALQKSRGDLEYLPSQGLWSVSSFVDIALPFYGWDAKSKMSLTKRNYHMVASLMKALEKYNRIYVMVGARHVPDLELITSRQVLCNKKITNNLEGYFSHIKNRYGKTPELSMSVGSTLPIYEFIKDKKYTVVFSEQFYDDLKKVMKEFQKNEFKNNCINI